MAHTSRPTLQDVADRAGVSRATVSRVVRDKPDVNPLIVAKVQAVIKELNYRVNPVARSLAGGSSQTIGIVFHEDLGDVFQNAMWGQILKGIYSVFSQKNFQMTILVNDKKHSAQVLDYLMNGHVDGVIILGIDPNERLAEALIENRVPVTFLGNPNRTVKVSYVEGDDFAGGQLAADHLIGLGRRQLAMITGGPKIESSAHRVSGFIHEAAKHGITANQIKVVSGGFTQIGGYHGMVELLERYPNIDGLFVLSDLMAMGALEGLHEHGKNIPQDISVVSNDDSPNAQMTFPRLTSVGYNAEENGKSVAQLLLDMIDDKPIRHITFPPHLSIRASSVSSTEPNRN